MKHRHLHALAVAAAFGAALLPPAVQAQSGGARHTPAPARAHAMTRAQVRAMTAQNPAQLRALMNAGSLEARDIAIIPVTLDRGAWPRANARYTADLMQALTSVPVAGVQGTPGVGTQNATLGDYLTSLKIDPRNVLGLTLSSDRLLTLYVRGPIGPKPGEAGLNSGG